MISAISLDTAFPEITPGIHPLGARVLVQLRTIRNRTPGGIVLVDDTKAFNKSIAQVAKVIELGPLAFKNRDTLCDWVEGVWAKPGDFVRVPRYGGDRMERVMPNDKDDTIIFCIFNDYELIAKVDPFAFEEIDEIL